MQKSLWLFFTVALLFMASSAIAQERAANTDPDDTRGYATEVKESGKKVFKIQDGKVVPVNTASAKAQTALEKRKLKEIKNFRVIVSRKKTVVIKPVARRSSGNQPATPPKVTDK